MNAHTPTLGQAVDARIFRILRSVNTVAVGSIESYSDSTGRASVQLVVEAADIGEDGERTTAKRPIVVEVPVVFQGSGRRYVKFPINAGDLCVVLFAQHSLDKWLAAGGNSVDPGDDRRFHLSDAIAITGLDRELEDADAIIEFKADGTICIGAGAFIPSGPTGDGLVKAGAIDPFTGQTQAVLNAAFITATLLAK